MGRLAAMSRGAEALLVGMIPEQRGHASMRRDLIEDRDWLPVLWVHTGCRTWSDCRSRLKRGKVC